MGQLAFAFAFAESLDSLPDDVGDVLESLLFFSDVDSDFAVDEEDSEAGALPFFL
jgi:hypothetical protein